MSHDVMVVGTICEDLFPTFDDQPVLSPGALLEVGPLRTQPGGCVANTGFALADLGSSTCLAADIGDDAMGDVLLAHIAARGVDGGAVRRVPGRSTSYSVVVEGSGDRCIWHHVGANAGFDGAQVGGVRVDILHLGYPSLLERLAHDSGACLVSFFTRKRAQGATTSLDLAVVDRASTAGAVDWASWLANVLPATDVFAPSHDDLRSIGLGATDGVAGTVEAARRMLALGPAVVALKDSTAGIVLVTAGRARLEAAGIGLRDRAADWADACLWMPALDVVEASTAGAGDTAVAGLLHGIAQGLAPDDALRCAAAAAAARVEGGGAIPRWEELTRRLDRGWPTREAPPPQGCDVLRARAGMSS